MAHMQYFRPLNFQFNDCMKVMLCICPPVDTLIIYNIYTQGDPTAISSVTMLYSPMRGRIKGLEMVVTPIAVTALGDILTTSWVISKEA